MELNELIEKMEQAMNKRDLSDEYLKSVGRETREYYAFGEYHYGMTDIPEVKEFYAMAEKALRTQNQVNWISVKDRLPEPDVKTIGRIETEKVIAWDGNRLVFGNFTIYRHDNSFEFYGADADRTYCFWKVTHWMPMPEPPERDDE